MIHSACYTLPGSPPSDVPHEMPDAHSHITCPLVALNILYLTLDPWKYRSVEVSSPALLSLDKRLPCSAQP